MNLVRAIETGRFVEARRDIRGIAFREGDRIIATPAHEPIQDLDSLTPDWGMLQWEKYQYIPLGGPRGNSQLRARLPVHLLLLLPVEVLANLPHPHAEELRRRDRDAGQGAPGRVLHPGRRGADDPPGEVHRPLPGAHRPQARRPLGHQHARHRHLARRGHAALLPEGRAGTHFARDRGVGAAAAGALPEGDRRSPRTRRP